jgi:hypothetical protein
LEKLFSCGESPEGKLATILPSSVLITWTTFAVDAETRSLRPLREIDPGAAADVASALVGRRMPAVTSGYVGA